MTVLLGLPVGGCAGKGGPGDTPFAEVPHPSTEAMEPMVQEQIQGARGELEEALAAPREDPRRLGRAFGELGLIYHAYGLAPAAEACYVNAQRLQSEAKLWPYAAGRLQLDALGRLEEAAASFRRALELEPDDFPARIYLGRTLLALGRPEEAATEFRRATKGDGPGAATAFDGLGRAAADRGAFDEAVGHFRRALELQPGAGRVAYRLAQALKRAGRAGEARDVLAGAGAGGGGAGGGETVEVVFRDPLEEQLAERARGVSAAVRWGGVAQLAGDLEGAARAFRHAVSLAPEDAAARLSLGNVLAQQGDVAGAVEQYGEAIALEAANATSRYNLGQLLLRSGRLEEAEDAFRKALELEPALLDARLALASVFEQQDRYEAALEAYDQVLATDPANLQARTWRAVAYARGGDEERALSQLEELVAAAPAFPQARLQLAILLARLERWHDARGHFEAVLRQNPPATIRQRAESSLEALARREAGGAGGLEALKALASAAPGDPAAQRSLARELGRAGHYRAAADAYRAAVEAGGGDGATRLAEATALVLAGSYGPARRRLEEGIAALSTESGSPDIGLAHALARLLAAAPEASVRDPRRSLDLAEAVHRSLGTLDSAETLAMALAANGRYPEAARLQRQVLDAAASLDDPALLNHLRANLERYQAAQPATNPFRQ